MLTTEPAGVTTSVAPREWSPSRRIHVLTFRSPSRVLEAVERLRRERFIVVDVHSPFPVHGLERALGLRPTRLGLVTLVAGAVGGLVALAFQIWVHAFDWPMGIGGKDDLALLALVPVTFELTVLAAAVATFLALLWRRGLYPRVDGASVSLPHPRVTDDVFAVLVDERNASFDPRRFDELCDELGAEEVIEGWKVQ